MMAVNMSVWENVEALENYVWQTVHKRFYGRRHEWFEPMDERYLVMWWVPAGHRPTIAEAIERLEHLKTHGAERARVRLGDVPRRNSGKRRGAHERDHANRSGAAHAAGALDIAASLTSRRHCYLDGMH